jgi:hypothetical protein
MTLTFLHPGLENLQTLVAGNIEAVSGDDWHFYLNEEGKILNPAPVQGQFQYYRLQGLESGSSPTSGTFSHVRGPFGPLTWWTVC